jgi:hypothetical protein
VECDVEGSGIGYQKNYFSARAHAGIDLMSFMCKAILFQEF